VIVLIAIAGDDPAVRIPGPVPLLGREDMMLATETIERPGATAQMLGDLLHGAEVLDRPQYLQFVELDDHETLASSSCS
jgi:hypothetical protein